MGSGQRVVVGTPYIGGNETESSRFSFTTTNPQQLQTELLSVDPSWWLSIGGSDRGMAPKKPRAPPTELSAESFVRR